jgi:pimeloyl-ACP methyl ester carboxylesterase
VFTKSDPRALLALGLGILARRAGLQSVVDSLHPESDLTDFALGVVMGIAIGLTLLGLWWMRRSVTCGFALLLALGLGSSGCSVAPHPITIAMDGQAIHVDDGGQRRRVPIVFIHGNGGNAEQWRAQLDHFRRNGHRAVAIDLPGFGKSTPAVGGDYSLNAMAAVIDRATTEIGLKRFVLAGHSYAGAVVAQYAATHPEKVAGIIYVDAAAVVLPLTGEQQEQVKAALRADRMQMVRAMFAPMLKPSQDSVRDAVFASVERSAEDAFTGALFSLANWAPQELVNAYHGPRLAIAASDLETPFSFQKQFPDITAVRVAGAGHWLMLDKPDEVNSAIQNFVATLQ